MKLAVVFEVPDDQADTYAGVAARMIKHHQFAKEHEIAHWSFDMQMRPVAAAIIAESVLTDQTEAADALAALLIERPETPKPYPYPPRDGRAWTTPRRPGR